MTTAESAPGPRWVLLAREREQLGRVAERIRKGRRVLAFLACQAEHRGEVVAWLSKETGRELACPAEGSAAELLTGLESAAGGQPQEVVSLAWRPGDHDAIATLNLHREKLRRGASVLLWCVPEDLRALLVEGQDAYSFRDTLILLSGFPVPPVHVPSDDTPEIRLARARLALPGTAFEKALAAAELGTLLLDRGYYQEAAATCDAAVRPFLTEEMHDAGRETLAYLMATQSAAMAAAGDVSSARRYAIIAIENRPWTAAVDEVCAVFLSGIEPTSGAAFAAARALQGVVVDLAWESSRQYIEICIAEDTASAGALRIQWPPRWSALFSKDSDLSAGPGIVALARGDIDDATAILLRAAADAARRDEDNRHALLRAVDSLIAEGELDCANELLKTLDRARPTDWLPFDAIVRRAFILALTGHVAKALRLLRIEEPPSSFLDGLVYRSCATLASVVRVAFLAGRLGIDDVAATLSYLAESEGRFPPPDEDDLPFYRVLFPSLRADLMSLSAERRGEAIALARSALDVARAEVPQYAPDHAARLVRCLLLQNRFDDAFDVLPDAEREAESQDHCRALSSLRALRAVAHVRRGDGAPVVDAAMATLRETLEATGSPRIAAETLIVLARDLPPACPHPDVLALVDETAERFAEMPMPAQEELCRETRGDALLARGRGDEAAACFARAAKRLEHYGILLRVPLLRAKRDAALGKPARDPAGGNAPD